MLIHKTRVVSSSPACVTIKTLLVRKVTGNELTRSTSQKEAQSPVSGHCYATYDVAYKGPHKVC